MLDALDIDGRLPKTFGTGAVSVVVVGCFSDGFNWVSVTGAETDVRSSVSRLGDSFPKVEVVQPTSAMATKDGIA
ncbi:MAG: hypothetical protein EOP06_09470 [Proteobacteria bacterium]|nr:MAG: hypothetical protein EOP06_09470 [Pseudomonadota bacterium]